MDPRREVKQTTLGPIERCNQKQEREDCKYDDDFEQPHAFAWLDLNDRSCAAIVSAAKEKSEYNSRIPSDWRKGVSDVQGESA